MNFPHLHVAQRFLTLPTSFYHLQSPLPLSHPKLRSVNKSLATTLGFTEDDIAGTGFLALVSGQRDLENAQPLAMKYCGHQFGTYNPELGDGRGLLIAELQSQTGQHYELHLKGAGKTPFSRFGDGRAVLRSSIREYLASEAMHALGISTTRALSLVSSDELVQREEKETAAMVVRVTPSHIRFGHFEYCFYTKQFDALRTLADHVIEHHYPECKNNQKPYVALLEAVIKRTAIMVAHWQAVGFCHGVMNTDNMSILGETFDYGPYAFLDEYNQSFICNHSDYTGRYAFDQQPIIAQWNLSALAYALTPLIDKDTLNALLDTFMPLYKSHYYKKMAQKLGLSIPTEQESDDATNLCNRQLVDSLIKALQSRSVDYSQFFRELSDISCSQLNSPEQLTAGQYSTVREWLTTYQQFIQKTQLNDEQRLSVMQQHNPTYVLRNHYAQQAIAAAEQGDYSVFERLFSAISTPFSRECDYPEFVKPPEDENKGIALSCSS